jgi:hypothetical protein
MGKIEFVFIGRNVMISEYKLKHMIQVARFMKQYCKDKGFDDNYCQEMFTLGLLHDIGYEFEESPEHNKVGGLLLKNQNYKYFNEVMNHGNPYSDYSSCELDILNYADLHVDAKGKFVSFTERLDDIKNRYGENSDSYKSARTIAENLISKGFN